MSLPIDPSASTAQAFSTYQLSLSSYLRYRLAEFNLQVCHDLDRPLHVLDAAGGNGIVSEFLLERGHQVTLYDADPEMHSQAKARLGPRNLLERCTFLLGTLEEMATILANKQFDLIVCHHAIEYVADGPHLLTTFNDLAAPNGELSLITLNPVSEAIRAMIFKQDPALARRKLTDLSYDAKWFGHAQLYPFEEIVTRAELACWRLKDFRGIRVLADYIDEPNNKGNYDDLMRLEESLAGSEPYRRFGRYLQFCFRNNKAT